MSFDFDSGAPVENVFGTDAARSLLDSVLDRLPVDAPEAQINDLLCQTICGELRARKTGEGVARTFWRYAEIISRMREHSPDCHDQVILEFAEMLTALPWRYRRVRAGAESPEPKASPIKEQQSYVF